MKISIHRLNKPSIHFYFYICLIRYCDTLIGCHQLANTIIYF